MRKNDVRIHRNSSHKTDIVHSVHSPERFIGNLGTVSDYVLSPTFMLAFGKDMKKQILFGRPASASTMQRAVPRENLH